jgi:hypothetical protein
LFVVMFVLFIFARLLLVGLVGLLSIIFFCSFPHS